MTITSATLHYFDIPGKPSSFALGENLNLFLKDSGVDYKYVRHSQAEWPALKEDLKKKHNVAHPTMPYVEIDGKVWIKTVPTMRYLSKQLGKYLGSDDEENYTLDIVADSVRDHFAALLIQFRSDDQGKLNEYVETNTKKFLGVYDSVYGVKEGPYILGEEISYVDFLVYHIVDDDFAAMDLVNDYPNLAKFIKTFVQRPNLATYFDSLKK